MPTIDPRLEGNNTLITDVPQMLQNLPALPTVSTRLLAMMGRPDLDLKAVGTLATALLIFALIPVPSTQDPLIQPFTSADAVTQALRDGPPCATEGQPHCTFIPMWPDLAINYGTASTDSGYEIAGFVSDQVTRLVYLPAPGADPVTIPLGRIPTTNGIQAFTLRAGDTTFAQLKAYDNTGALIGEFGNKLRI